MYHSNRVEKSIREGSFVILSLVHEIWLWLSRRCDTVYVVSANIVAIEYSLRFIGTGIFSLVTGQLGITVYVESSRISLEQYPSFQSIPCDVPVLTSIVSRHVTDVCQLDIIFTIQSWVIISATVGSLKVATFLSRRMSSI
jgi:hypothetical protein